MSYVITQPCIGTKDRSCVEVCPVDCFYNNPDKNLNEEYKKVPAKDGDVGMLIIHPDECIHCGACEPECPVDAIYEDDDVPSEWEGFVQLNSKIAESFSDEELDKNRVTSKG